MTEVVPNSSYYVHVPSVNEMHYYDVDGNLLRRVPIEAHQHGGWAHPPPPFDDMLDSACVGKARPVRVVISTCPKRGRCAWFYDRHDNIILIKKYTGLTSLLLQFSRGEVDVDWMIEHEVPIVDHEQATVCSLV